MTTKETHLIVRAIFDDLLLRIQRVIDSPLVRREDASILKAMYLGEVNGMMMILLKMDLSYPELSADIANLHGDIDALLDDLHNRGKTND